jgi:exodeoxyribonuclease VII large subunit
MDLFADKRILSVSQLTGLIRGVLEENFEHVWVEGEVSNLAAPGSGHVYFTLKDASAQLRCVVFRASSRALKFRLANGMGMVLRGRISVYDQRGDYQFIAEYLERRALAPCNSPLPNSRRSWPGRGCLTNPVKECCPACRGASAL